MPTLQELQLALGAYPQAIEENPFSIMAKGLGSANLSDMFDYTTPQRAGLKQTGDTLLALAFKQRDQAQADAMAKRAQEFYDAAFEPKNEKKRMWIDLGQAAGTGLLSGLGQAQAAEQVMPQYQRILEALGNTEALEAAKAPGARPYDIQLDLMRALNDEETARNAALVKEQQSSNYMRFLPPNVAAGVAAEKLGMGQDLLKALEEPPPEKTEETDPRKLLFGPSISETMENEIKELEAAGEKRYTASPKVMALHKPELEERKLLAEKLDATDTQIERLKTQLVKTSDVIEKTKDITGATPKAKALRLIHTTLGTEAGQALQGFKSLAQDVVAATRIQGIGAQSDFEAQTAIESAANEGFSYENNKRLKEVLVATIKFAQDKNDFIREGLNSQTPPNVVIQKWDQLNREVPLWISDEKGKMTPNPKRLKGNWRDLFGIRQTELPLVVRPTGTPTPYDVDLGGGKPSQGFQERISPNGKKYWVDANGNPVLRK